MTNIEQNTIRDEIVNLAAVPATGDYAADCALGRQLANALCERMFESQIAGTLGSMVREMVAAGQFTNVHVGFFQRIGERAALS